MANKHDLRKNQFMLKGALAKNGYDWWWHSFTAYNEKPIHQKLFILNFLHVIQN